MAEDGKIVYKVVLDDSGVDEQAASAGERAGKSFGGALGKLSTVGKAVGVAAVAVGTAVVGVGTAVAKETGKLAEYGDHIDKMSQKLGLSAEAYQEWDAVLQHSGVSIDSLEPSMKNLFQTAQKGSEAFTRLGISAEEAASMTQQDLFEATITALQGISDENEKAALAQELFGRGAQELMPLLNTTAEETDAMRARVHELGGVLSDEAVKSAAAYKDTLQDLQTAMQGVTNQIVAEFLPGITSVMAGITEIFAGDSENGVQMVTEGLDNILNGLMEAMPKVLEVAGQIAINLITGFIERLPEMIETGLTLLVGLLNGIASAIPKILPVIVQVIKSIILGLVNHLPDIIMAGINILLALVEGIVDAIPELISMIPQIITSLITGLLNHLPEIITAGIQLLIALTTGLIQAIPQLVMMLPQIIKAIIDAFKQVNWAELGMNIVQGIWEGIKALWGSLVSGITSSLSELWNWAKKILGIASPSKKFKYIGEMSVEGTIEGFEDQEGAMVRTVKDIYSELPGTAEDAMRTVGVPSLMEGGRESMERSVSYNLQASGAVGSATIIIPLALDGREIARATAWTMGEQLAWEEI